MSVSCLTVCLPKGSSIFSLGLLAFFFSTGTYWLWTGTYNFSQDELQDSPLSSMGHGGDEPTICNTITAPSTNALQTSET